MRNRFTASENVSTENSIILINQIYKSFEALEKTLGLMQFDEPLFIINVAKKSFANQVCKGYEKKEPKMCNFKN